jgi:hypothetical protein
MYIHLYIYVSLCISVYIWYVCVCLLQLRDNDPMSRPDPTHLHLDAELNRLMARLLAYGGPDKLHGIVPDLPAPVPPPASLLQASRLTALAAAFALTAFEVELLLLALAPALDTRFGRALRALLDDPLASRPTVGLALDLLDIHGVARLAHLQQLTTAAPLLEHHLLLLEDDAGAPSTPLIARSLIPDATLLAWLLGSYQPPAALGVAAQLELPGPAGDDIHLCAATWSTLVDAMHGQSISCFYGADRAAQQATAREIARGMNSPLLTIDLRLAQRQGVPPGQAVAYALRDGRLTGAIVALQQMDVALEQERLLPEVQARLFAHTDLVITTGNSAWMPEGDATRQAILWREFAMPGYGRRETLWRAFLGDAAGRPGLDPAVLAGLFRFTGGQIRDTVRAAQDHALARSADAQLVRDDLLAAARAYSGAKLDELAHRITPRHRWEDLILRPDQIVGLQEVLAMVRRRAQVLDGWGVGRKLSAGAAVTMLFAGEPGTGKTMAAEVIAGELGLELYKIDLSAMVSKYIGETEKNLEQIFKEAEQGNAILFFDEADAIFGKRSGIKDAHDRYANIGVSYLLQRMESYEGVTILATNLRSNLDDAFLRRLHAVIDFPFPDEAARLRMWESMFPPDLPRRPDLDFKAIAKRYPLSGGGIRNIIVHAAFLAAEAGEPVGMAHLATGLRREYQKMGRLIYDGDLNLAPPTPAPIPGAPPTEPRRRVTQKPARTSRRPSLPTKPPEN